MQPREWRGALGSPAGHTYADGTAIPRLSEGPLPSTCHILSGSSPDRTLSKYMACSRPHRAGKRSRNSNLEGLLANNKVKSACYVWIPFGGSVLTDRPADKTELRVSCLKCKHLLAQMLILFHFFHLESSCNK